MLKTLFMLILVLVASSCFLPSKTVNVNEEVTIKKNETANIKNTPLSLKMLSNGHSTTGNGEIIFCKFEIINDGKAEQRTLDVGKTTNVGNLKINLTKVDTTANPQNSDPWSETSCSFTVTS